MLLFTTVKVRAGVRMGRLKMWEWKMRYGQKCKGGKCGSGKCRIFNVPVRIIFSVLLVNDYAHTHRCLGGLLRQGEAAGGIHTRGCG